MQRVIDGTVEAFRQPNSNGNLLVTIHLKEENRRYYFLTYQDFEFYGHPQKHYTKKYINRMKKSFLEAGWIRIDKLELMEHEKEKLRRL